MKLHYTKVLLVMLLTVCTTFSFGQQNEILPASLTPSEGGILTQYEFTNSRITPPPAGPVRTMAEWEEVEYLVLTWQPSFPNILRQIVAAAVNECNVIIVTQNEATVSSYLTSNGIDISNVTFLDVPWNSIWIRDYAGNTVYSDDVGQRNLVDWIYNRPRPDDDVIPAAHASLLGLPFYATDSGTNDLVNTGGNFMSDGLGNAFASELVLDENAAGNPYGVSAKTEAQIDDIMFNYMGIENYIKMTPLPYDVINHIDMHMKLLDEETLLVAEYPTGVADGPQIEANIDYVLSNFQSAFGTPFKVKRIDSPPSEGGNYPDNGGYYRNYTNAVFINKTILIPTYRPEVDGPALAQWEEMMPGYNIVGIDVDNQGENLISQVGAIHCITHTIGVADPLLIVHQPVAEAGVGSNVSIDALIKHESDISEASVFWRQEGDTNFSEVAMSFVSEDNWTVDLSIPSEAIDIEYYITAESNSGKTMSRPMVAPEGFWTMNVANLGVNDLAAQSISAPYPNPTTGEVRFDLDQIDGPVLVTVHNLLGQKLDEITIDSGRGTMKLQLNRTWQGTLFITFEGDFGRVTKKVIKI